MRGVNFFMSCPLQPRSLSVNINDLMRATDAWSFATSALVRFFSASHAPKDESKSAFASPVCVAKSPVASFMVTFLSCAIRPTLVFHADCATPRPNATNRFVSLLALSAAMWFSSAAFSLFPAAVTTWAGRVRRVVARRGGWKGGVQFGERSE